MKIALLSNLHLSDIMHTPQEEAFDWALEELGKVGPDACVWLGDITACGSTAAAMRFYQKINSLSCPSLVVPGSSDLFTAATAPVLERYLISHPNGLKIGDLHIVGLDTSHGCILPEEKARLARLKPENNIMLCSHQSAKHLDTESLEFLENWIADHQKNSQQILLWANGPEDNCEQAIFENLPTLSVRALDLDTCKGGSAQIRLWDSETGNVQDLSYTRGLLGAWTEEERLELADALGISCYNPTKVERDMPFAIANRVRHLEWRMHIAEEELPLIEQWRKVGGQSFSLHLPALKFDNAKSLDSFRNSALDAVRAQADRVTVHPPQIAIEQMSIGSPVFDIMADTMAEALLPVAAAGIDILVENNHTDSDTPNDPMKCAYGCTPMEISEWRNALNTRLGKGSCHLRFDVGHAKNNFPRSNEYPIGKWYAMIGADVRSYHMHQTIIDAETGKMKNHYHLTDWNDGLISYDGFLWAWHTGLLYHGPIILEVAKGEGAPATWLRLQQLIKAENVLG